MILDINKEIIKELWELTLEEYILIRLLKEEYEVFDFYVNSRNFDGAVLNKLIRKGIITYDYSDDIRLYSLKEKI